MATQGEKLKARLKKTAKHGFLALGRTFPTTAPHSRILTYHSVGRRNHEMNVRRSMFRTQMEWLAAHRKIIPLEAAARGEEGVAITFDDGYRDNLVHAAPILSELGLPATVFIVCGRLGGLLDHDTDPRTSTLLSWAEVSELEKMGITIGNHTLSHRRLAALSAEEQRSEIFDGYRLMADTLGHSVTSFAYPYGSLLDFDENSIRLVKECGHVIAVSNSYGTNRAGADPWTLKRMTVDRTDNLDTFQAKVDGRLDGLAWLEWRPAVHARRLMNRVLRTG